MRQNDYTSHLSAAPHRTAPHHAPPLSAPLLFAARRNTTPMIARRPARRRPSATPERRFHIALADRLRAEGRPGWWWSHVPSGELRTKATAALLERLGLKPGMSDFILIAPDGGHHWLELKSA